MPAVGISMRYRTTRTGAVGHESSDLCRHPAVLVEQPGPVSPPSSYQLLGLVRHDHEEVGVAVVRIAAVCRLRWRPARPVESTNVPWSNGKPATSGQIGNCQRAIESARLWIVIAETNVLTWRCSSPQPLASTRTVSITASPDSAADRGAACCGGSAIAPAASIDTDRNRGRAPSRSRRTPCDLSRRAGRGATCKREWSVRAAEPRPRLPRSENLRLTPLTPNPFLSRPPAGNPRPATGACGTGACAPCRRASPAGRPCRCRAAAAA